MSQGQGKVSYGLVRWPFASLPSGSHLSVLGSRCQCICLHFPWLGKFRKIKGAPGFPSVSLVSWENVHLNCSIPCIGWFSDQRTFMTWEKNIGMIFYMQTKITIMKHIPKHFKNRNISNKINIFQKRNSKHLSGKKRKPPFCPPKNISTNLITRQTV
jgi:hypothetical protein